MAQASGLGVDLGDQVISAIGQADDIVLVSNCLHSLLNLLNLSLSFCSDHHINLCVDKTKLIAVSTPSMALSVDYAKLTSPVNINGVEIPFTSTAEHVGILRNEHSNLPHLMGRIKAHQNALNAVLHTGAARHHRGNPAASLRIDQMYAIPSLLSGIGAIPLLKSEIDMIDHHLKETHEQLLRLHPRTPQPVVCFLAGCLPGSALVHLRIFSIFVMICMQEDGILHHQALRTLIRAKQSSRSWFTTARDLCLQYGLPHPIELLQTNQSKEQVRNLMKKAVLSYWEQKLRDEAEPLLSLEYFKPQFMSLTSPHPILTTAGSNSYQTAMSTVQALMLSGRYRTELLCSKWAPQSSGSCLTPTCKGLGIPEGLQHILVSCGSLEETRKGLTAFTDKQSAKHPEIKPLIDKYYCPQHPDFPQFIIDCSVLPDVI